MEKYLDTTLTAQERAEDLTDRMTTEEQAAQLKYDAPAVERLGIPAYNWWNEALHGVARAGTATVYPQAIGFAAMFDAELLERIGSTVADDVRALYNELSARGDRDIYKGLTVWAPNINIFRDPRWGRGQETYGEDPYLTARLGVSYVNGLQGSEQPLKAAACAKHFAVHSGPEATRHEFDARVNEKDLTETYLPAFKALVEKAHVEGVMGAYNCVNGEPACANSYLMEKLREWGFDGYFVSDCWAIRDFHENHGVTKTAPESASLALKQGCDLNCGNTYLHILAALDEGRITKEDIRNACVHLMRTRIRLGLFEKTKYDELDYNSRIRNSGNGIALQAAKKSMVLLKNNGILPLDAKKLRRIGVIGPNADSRAALEGNYCGKSDRYVTFLQGIQNAFDGEVLYAEGCHLYKDRISSLALPEDRIAEAEVVAKYSDAVILCVGLDPTIEGEEGDTGNEFSSGDKRDLRLPEAQRTLIKHVTAMGKPVIIVTAAGSAINLEADCDALLHVWYPGQAGGTALASILFGKTSPSGKLPVTFYENADLLPDFSDYSLKNRTYRYANGNVLYPFGYGLTYGDVRVESAAYNDGRVEFTAKNYGKADTDDVVEVYVKVLPERENQPRYSLCGFSRVSVRSGESVNGSCAISPDAFTYVDDSGNRQRGHEFLLYVGTSQPDELSGRLTGNACLVIKLTV